MKRRSFLSGLSVLAPAAATGQQPSSHPHADERDRLARLRPRATPAIALNHLGFLSKSKKILIVRVAGSPAPTEYRLEVTAWPGRRVFTRPLEPFKGDLGDCCIADFSDVEQESFYQITVGDEGSVPFFIRPDVWRRTLPKAVSYFHAQRCGIAVPYVHPACHLDDALRRDNGEYVDTTGGWHDAGDTRKWMANTLYSGFGLMQLARNLGEEWDLAGSGLGVLLDEMRWGNRYFLKMQDSDGRVWFDVGAGINGDNSDNHWTDNVAGTRDDRHINTTKAARIQAMFTFLQALVAQVFQGSDPGYAQVCLRAAARCWDAADRDSAGGEDLGWWTLAAAELYRAAKSAAYASAAASLASRLLSLQTTDFIGSQRMVRGFWRASAGGHDPSLRAIVPLALLESSVALPEHTDAKRWRDGVRMYLDECILPLSARSAYQIVPGNLYLGSPEGAFYRPLAGELTYRYFSPPPRNQLWNFGHNPQLQTHAVLLARAARIFHDRRYSDLAYRQLEWIMGANPFGACQMTGEGMRNIYPFSRFAGLIPGGLPNGIAGDGRDEPLLDTDFGFDYKTAEYCSPHNGLYVWAVSLLEELAGEVRSSAG